jgi:hypothetical protein
MRRIVDRIKNSEFLTFSEVLRLKVFIVTLFLITFILLTIPLSSFNDFTINIKVFVPMAMGLLIVLTILFMAINLNRFAMHTSAITISILTIYYSQGTNHFYGYILFFVALTIIIFYQDILAYLFYGGILTGIGIYYIFDKGTSIVGINAIDPDISLLTYLIVLVGFYVVFLIQFLISDNIYEKMNNEWVRMNHILQRYQSSSFRHLSEMEEQHDQEPIWRNPKFQQTVHELSLFLNEFFEKDAQRISEVVEYYFFLHTQDIEEVIENKNASIIAKRYAVQFEKYLINRPSELMSILFDFATLFKPSEPYHPMRYEYHLDDLLPDRVDTLLALAILYRYLRHEVTQFDQWGNIKNTMTHDEITALFQSPEFREFLSYEQVNFYLDNEALFRDYL